MKFLAFEQTFKDCLTTPPHGRRQGRSDFDQRVSPTVRSCWFCQAFMNELYRHIGENTDVPCG